MTDANRITELEKQMQTLNAAHETNVKELKAELKANTDITLRVQNSVQELLDAFVSFKGAFKVLGWLGTLAKWIGYIAVAVGAVVAAIKGVNNLDK